MSALAIDKRSRNAAVAINNAMYRNNVTAKDIEKNKIMHRNTFYAKLENPERFRFDDFWKLDALLHFNEYEMGLITGRECSGQTFL